MSGPFDWQFLPWDSPQRIDSGKSARPNTYDKNGLFSPGSGADPVTRSGDTPGFPRRTGLVPVTAPHWYANLIEGNITVGTSNALAISSPGFGVRNFLGFRNAGTTNLYISFGGIASTISYLKLAAGDIVLFDTVVPQNDINVYSDAAGGIFSYAYGTTVDQ